MKNNNLDPLQELRNLTVLLDEKIAGLETNLEVDPLDFKSYDELFRITALVKKAVSND